MGAILKRHEVNRRRNPKRLLKGYENFLASCVRLGKKWGELSDERLDYLLWHRSELQLAFKQRPDGLTLEERRHLRGLDKQLRALAPFIIKGEPRLHEWAKQLGYPRSHWWWYLTERTKKRRKAYSTVQRRET